MNALCLLLSIMLLISSCSPKITYMISDITASEKKDLKNVSVAIVITEDDRREESPFKQSIFSDRSKNKVECYNLEKEYYGLSVPVEINRCIVNHMKEKKCFKNVFLKYNDSADFIVSIQLKSFAANTSVNPEAKNAENFYWGLNYIGALYTLDKISKLKSELSYSIDYGTVNILDKKNGISLPAFKFHSSGKFQIPAVTNCYQIYNHLNSSLKTHNDSFVEQIASEIEKQIKGFRGGETEEVVE